MVPALRPSKPHPLAVAGNVHVAGRDRDPGQGAVIRRDYARQDRAGHRTGQRPDRGGDLELDAHLDLQAIRLFGRTRTSLRFEATPFVVTNAVHATPKDLRPSMDR